VKQWRYTGAPDADARVIQVMAWAARWVREQGKDPEAVLPMQKAARMGDSLRYALHDKYFRTQHNLIAWSQAWGGSIDPDERLGLEERVQPRPLRLPESRRGLVSV